MVQATEQYEKERKEKSEQDRKSLEEEKIRKFELEKIKVKAEAEAEKKAAVKAQRDWEAEQEKKRVELEAAGVNATEALANTEDLGLADVKKVAVATVSENQQKSQSEIEKLVLEHKKREMLERYASDSAADDLISQYQSSEMRDGSGETKELLANEPRA